MKIYNTLSGKKEDFKPQNDEIKMYVCGVTPYAQCHVGHAMSYIVFDVISRYFEFLGYKVKYVQNFTDVDDKIIARSNQLGITSQELADKFIAEYFEDMDALNIKRATIYPRATQEIPEIVKVVKGLEEKGYAYEVNGNVYFRVSSFQDYGKLSRRDLDEMQSGARIEIGEEKEHPLDFALWKSAKPDEPSWESPWGKGRPGWHIECSVMSLKYLGATLDIHGGGQDLVFPHHENEIAQSEAFTGTRPFARFWIHNGLMQLGKDKMSKSSGNLVTVKEILSKHSADALRLLVLSSYYRKPLNFSEESLEAMERGAERLTRSAREKSKNGEEMALDLESYRQKFIEFMDDDFNTSGAMATLFDLAREINRGREEGLNISRAQETLLELAEVLGLKLEEGEASEEGLAKSLIELLIQLRSELRAEKKWQLADTIRSRLGELGIVLEDSSEGTTWHLF